MSEKLRAVEAGILISTEDFEAIEEVRRQLYIVILDVVFYWDLVKPNALKKIDNYVISLSSKVEELNDFLNYFSHLRKNNTKHRIGRLIPEEAEQESEGYLENKGEDVLVFHTDKISA